MCVLAAGLWSLLFASAIHPEWPAIQLFLWLFNFSGKASALFRPLLLFCYPLASIFPSSSSSFQLETFKKLSSDHYHQQPSVTVQRSSFFLFLSWWFASAYRAARTAGGHWIKKRSSLKPIQKHLAKPARDQLKVSFVRTFFAKSLALRKLKPGYQS